jgi:uncharacterized membrane protein
MSEIKPDQRDIEANRVIAAIGYVWILCLVPLFLKRKSKFAQFHAKQGLLLFVLEIVGWLVFWIPVIGWVILILIILFAILGIKNALDGKFWVMPIIGKYVNKFNL